MSDKLAINTIRGLSIDMVQAANSGHPGAPLGCAAMGHVLYANVMNHSPSNPGWFNRDRFVLSNGHACALQYSLLHLCGYSHFDEKAIKNFRQLGSATPGHPEYEKGSGVEVTTGPLGQGVANAVGLAIASKHMAARYNKPDAELLGNFVYAICGDGCLQEGVSGEASSVAGHLGLGNLIVLYDDNNITIDGGTELSFSEDVGKRYESYGWDVTSVEKDGHSDFAAVQAAVEAAKKVTDKPSIIKVRTVIGFGAAKAGTQGVHGSPLGPEDVAAVKKADGLDPEKSFQVPDEVRALYDAVRKAGDEKAAAWEAQLDAYVAKYPEDGAELKRRIAGELPAGWESILASATPDDKALATRASSGNALNALAELLPELVGGSADLNPSCLTYLKCSGDLQKESFQGRNVRYGVREHAMAAISNGLAAYGGFIPFCSTFLNFVGYAWGAMRLSALAGHQVIYIMTHDSIGLGEDGPTHQPIEVIPLLRATPNMIDLRPADINEVSGAYETALKNTNRPSTLCLSRQGLPNLAGSSAAKVAFGAYAVVDVDAPTLILLATGSEVSLCVEAAKLIDGAKVRVVSMPSQQLFDDQSADYKNSVLPKGVPTLAVEAASAFGWHKYASEVHGMESFGASGKGADVFAHFGFTPEAIAAKAKAML